MPIRTNRGRAAVYRRLWGFPLRSPRHLVGTVIAVALLVTAIGVLVPQALGPRDRKSPQPAGIAAPSSSAAATTTAATPMPTRLTAPLLQPTSAAPNPDALNVAKLWARAWVNHPAGMTQAQWLDGLRPYTTEEYLAATMSTVDISNITATRVTGEPSVVSSFTSSLNVVVPTDGPKLSITVSEVDGGWRVSQYDQAS
ncbi:hypothetical protein FNH05_26330 [Amycolatopsis rhizosphaerae]|uniref:Uncharacterized protein n=1 Tax=Amycolatopsis rhizosphaerae TaxID=2053003 RepID=A0A558BF00_9PSEU|nr:hypothetical protein [Amycolatopsis rhizosphaerae]TVT35085.1 hypothetical protein FNH05_26330 [Amycolatopsis rhizosphaerae]